MSYVWTPEQIERYFGFYSTILARHTTSYLTFETTAEFARSVLPPCLEPAEAPEVTVTFSAFMEWLDGAPHSRHADQACLISVNAVREGEQGVYFLTVVEEDEMNIETGREFWGMPKKQGSIFAFEDGEELFAHLDREGHRLVEMSARLGEEQGPAEEETEIYFELRGHFGPNGGPVRSPELAIFEDRNVTKRFRPLHDPSLALGASRLDPGVATIPIGEFRGGGYIGGETTYAVRETIDLSGDGVDYAPYLLGRLHDEWPEAGERRIGFAPDSKFYEPVGSA